MSAIAGSSDGSPQSFTLVQSFGFAALLIVAGVMFTWVYLKRSGDQQVLALPQLEIPAISPIVTPSSEDEATELDETETWLQFGEEAYAAGRIVAPVADNALYYYQKALSRAPANSSALAGMDRVLRHLVSGAESAIFQGDWIVAREHAVQLRMVRPDDTRAAELLARINRLEQLENLLARADRQIAASRLTEPPGDNALQTYRRILEIEPGSLKAAQGIASIAQRLLGIAQSAALAGEEEKARRFIRRTKEIDARTEGLAEAEDLVNQWSEMVSNRHLQEQLEAASTALQEGRLAEPDQPNALALFEGVLELDPSSDAARQGKRLVIRALIDRAWSEIRGSRFDDAAGTALQARAAGAESFALVELEDELEFQQALADARRGRFDRLYAVSELDIKRREVPEYPRMADGSGWVELRFTVSENGEVLDAVIFDSSNEVFNDAALRAISRWTFKPHTFKGRPLPVRSGARFSFKE